MTGHTETPKTINLIYEEMRNLNEKVELSFRIEERIAVPCISKQTEYSISKSRSMVQAAGSLVIFLL
jgi:hypothetical protein